MSERQQFSKQSELLRIMAQEPLNQIRQKVYPQVL